MSRIYLLCAAGVVQQKFDLLEDTLQKIVREVDVSVLSPTISLFAKTTKFDIFKHVIAD